MRMFESYAHYPHWLHFVRRIEISNSVEIIIA